MNIDQFERAAAEIADQAIRFVHAGNHAERGGRRRCCHELSRRSLEMIAFAFASFALLVLAWFIAPSRSAVE